MKDNAFRERLDDFDKELSKSSDINEVTHTKEEIKQIYMQKIKLEGELGMRMTSLKQPQNQQEMY